MWKIEAAMAIEVGEKSDLNREQQDIILQKQTAIE